eukprot:3511047-Prorocentrum_lima.AAC.1
MFFLSFSPCSFVARATDANMLLRFRSKGGKERLANNPLPSNSGFFWPTSRKKGETSSADLKRSRQ